MQVLQLLLKDALDLNPRAYNCFSVKCPVDRWLQTRNVFLNAAFFANCGFSQTDFILNLQNKQTSMILWDFTNVNLDQLQHVYKGGIYIHHCQNIQIAEMSKMWQNLFEYS